MGRYNGGRVVGLIGVGTMGHPMATRLVEKGFRVIVFDVNRRAVEAAVDSGATAAATQAEIGASCHFVVTSLPSSAQVEEVLTGPGGVFETMASGGIVMDMSTIDPDTTRRVARLAAERGISMLDAPVSGAPPRARNGTLTIMVGGDAEVLARARHILEALGTNIFHVGPVGAGETVKLVNNILAAVNMTAVAEAFNIGVSSGVDPRVLYQVISTSTGDSSVLRTRVPYAGVLEASPANEGFAPGFAVDLMHKDLGLALDLARSANAPAFLTSVTYQLYRLARLEGHGGLDYSAVLKALQGPATSSGAGTEQ